MFLFEISGIPVPQKQTRFANGRAYDPSSKDKEFIQWQARHYAPSDPLLSPIQMDLTFYLPIPKSTSKMKKKQMINGIILPMKKPDIDNLAYIVTNALKTIFYKDDAQIIDLYLHKRYSEKPRTVVKIHEIHEICKTRGDECG